MIYGYVRVSTKEQNEDRQMIAMREFGVEKIFTDKQSGKDFNRPAYQKLIRKIKAGDVIVVQSLDRFGRDYDEIIEQWKLITKDKTADIVVLDMPLLDTRNDKNLTGRLIADIVLQLLAYVAQTEREFIRKRQREGIDAALARGVRFGRKAMPKPQEFDKQAQLYKEGTVGIREGAAALGVCPNTFSKWLEDAGFKDRAPSRCPGYQPGNRELKQETAKPKKSPKPPGAPKRHYNKAPKTVPYKTCRFISSVQCAGGNCAGCGWNPANAKKDTWSEAL